MKSITQQLKRFTDDERAVSPVVGFVLIFALVMIVFTIYQADVVPAQNKEVEFKHSQAVEDEMSRLNDAIQQAGSSGVPQSATIATGVQYPDRALAINPGSPAGMLSTGDPRTVTVSGLSDGSGYWSTDPTFETRLVSYHSNYNVLQQETTYTLENGMFVENFENGNTLLKSNGSVISDEGRRINLVLVEGEYQKSGVTTSLTATSASTSTEYRRLTSDGSGEIKLPTTLPESEWREMLDGVGVPHDGKKHASFGGYSPGSPNVVTIDLDSTSETYELRLSKVKFGGTGPTELQYLKNESLTNPTAEVTEPETLAASTHDELGNPSEATVDARVVTGSGTFARSGSDSVDNVQTDDDGRVSFDYVPDAADAGTTVEIELSIEDGSDDYETVTYELAVSDTSDDPDDIGGDIDNGYALDPSRRVTIDSATANGNAVDFEFNNRGDVDMTATRIQFSGYVGHFPSSDFATGGRFADTAVELNGETVTLNSPFTVGADSTTTATLSDLDASNVQTGLLIVSVQYEYTEGGTTKTDTATYSVPVLKDSGGDGGPPGSS